MSELGTVMVDRLDVELADLRVELTRAQRDERVDGRRADEAYAKKNVRRGRFFAQEARRDWEAISRISGRIAYLESLQRSIR